MNELTARFINNVVEGNDVFDMDWGNVTSTYRKVSFYEGSLVYQQMGISTIDSDLMLTTIVVGEDIYICENSEDLFNKIGDGDNIKLFRDEYAKFNKKIKEIVISMGVEHYWAEEAIQYVKEVARIKARELTLFDKCLTAEECLDDVPKDTFLRILCGDRNVEELIRAYMIKQDKNIREFVMNTKGMFRELSSISKPSDWELGMAEAISKKCCEDVVKIRIKDSAELIDVYKSSLIYGLMTENPVVAFRSSLGTLSMNNVKGIKYTLESIEEIYSDNDVVYKRGDFINEEG